MLAWTSSSGIPVQAYHTDMVAEAGGEAAAVAAAGEGGRAQEAWRLRGTPHGCMPEQGPAAFCGADHCRVLLGLDRVQQRFVSRTSKRPASVSGRGSGGAILRRDHVCRAVHT